MINKSNCVLNLRYRTSSSSSAPLLPPLSDVQYKDLCYMSQHNLSFLKLFYLLQHNLSFLKFFYLLLCQCVHIQMDRHQDRRTDRQTDGHEISIVAISEL